MKTKKELQQETVAIGAKTIAIDFDGVINSKSWPELGEPVPDIAKGLNILASVGYRLLLHTARVSSEWHYSPEELETIVALLKNYCFIYDLPIDEVWQGQGKPYAAHYLDDSAWCCNSNNFLEVCESIIIQRNWRSNGEYMFLPSNFLNKRS